jgi:hypothetical protein
VPGLPTGHLPVRTSAPEFDGVELGLGNMRHRVVLRGYALIQYEGDPAYWRRPFPPELHMYYSKKRYF